MRELKLILAVFALTMIAVPLPGFTITDVKFSWAIDTNNNPLDMVISPSKVKSLPIFAAFTILGTQSDIDELNQNGQLPVVLDWRVNGVVKASPQVGITPVEWIRDKAGLESQLQTQGFFTWRTFGFILLC